MKMFWKKKTASRSWEEISTPKTKEVSEDLDDNSCVEDKDTCDIADNSGNSDEDKTISSSIVKKNRKKGAEKFGKIIDNLDLDPTIYYGWGDGKVDTWMQKLTKIWNVIASVMWFIFGSITFAPILFTANKIDKFFNDKKKSFLISAILYVFVVILLLIVILF